MQYATENIIPVTLELGGKSPNIFFPSVMDADDEFFDKAIEGAVLFALKIKVKSVLVLLDYWFMNL